MGEIASKSLSALKDRKEEILSELGDIVGSSAANAIGDMASQQAATREKYGIDVDDGDDNQNRRPSFSEPPPSAQQQQQQQQHADSQPTGGTYGIWTSKPLVTMNMLTAMAGSRHAVQNSAVEVEPLPDGICVSRFGPISRKPVQMKNYSEPTAVPAGFGLHTRSTSTIQHPGGDGVGLHVSSCPPSLHPNLSPARSSRPSSQFGEAQFTVPHHGGRVCEDPEGAGGPAEEDQLPQRGGEQQPNGDEAGQAGHRAEDDREWDQGQTERDLPEPDVSTRRHQR